MTEKEYNLLKLEVAIISAARRGDRKSFFVNGVVRMIPMEEEEKRKFGAAYLAVVEWEGRTLSIHRLSEEEALMANVPPFSEPIQEEDGKVKITKNNLFWLIAMLSKSVRIYNESEGESGIPVAVLKWDERCYEILRKVFRARPVFACRMFEATVSLNGTPLVLSMAFPEDQALVDIYVYYGERY